MDEKEFQFGWDGSPEEEVFFHGFDHILFEGAYSSEGAPCMYHVMLLNDEETPVDFVLFLLQKVFHYTPDEASTIITNIHRDEMAICGTFTRDAAETKLMQVNSYARLYRHPLKCVLQRELEHAIKES